MKCGPPTSTGDATLGGAASQAMALAITKGQVKLVRDEFKFDGHLEAGVPIGEREMLPPELQQTKQGVRTMQNLRSVKVQGNQLAIDQALSAYPIK